MKDIYVDDLKQETDGWKRHQEKIKQLAEEHIQSLPWVKQTYNVENIDDCEDSLHMCGNIEEYKRYYSE